MYLTDCDFKKLEELKKHQTSLLKTEIELEKSLFIFAQYLLFKKGYNLERLAEKKKSKKKSEIL